MSSTALNIVMTKRKLLGIVVIVSFVVLSVLAYFAHQSEYFSWDLAISRFMQSNHNVFLDYFFAGVSWPGYPPQVTIFTPILIILIVAKKWFREAIWESVAGGIVSALGYTFKYWVNRPRAPETLVNIVHKGLEGGKYSFPAGHVETYVALLGFLAVIFFLKMQKSVKRSLLIGICLFLIIFVGPSRVYMGEHWASDVIGGYLVGLITLSITLIGYLKTKDDAKKTKELSQI